jgi:hypothetical protein
VRKYHSNYCVCGPKIETRSLDYKFENSATIFGTKDTSLHLNLGFSIDCSPVSPVKVLKEFFAHSWVKVKVLRNTQEGPNGGLEV